MCKGVLCFKSDPVMRGTANFWMARLKTFFLFGRYYDGIKLRNLRVINEDKILPTRVLVRRYRDMEIISMLYLAIGHKDSMGNGSIDVEMFSV